MLQFIKLWGTVRFLHTFIFPCIIMQPTRMRLQTQAGITSSSYLSAGTFSQRWVGLAPILFPRWKVLSMGKKKEVDKFRILWLLIIVDYGRWTKHSIAFTFLFVWNFSVRIFHPFHTKFILLVILLICPFLSFFFCIHSRHPSWKCI